jgi:hypothetical protein
MTPTTRDNPRRLNLHAGAVPLRRWTASNSAEPAAGPFPARRASVIALTPRSR